MSERKHKTHKISRALRWLRHKIWFGMELSGSLLAGGGAYSASIVAQESWRDRIISDLNTIESDARNAPMSDEDRRDLRAYNCDEEGRTLFPAHPDPFMGPLSTELELDPTAASMAEDMVPDPHKYGRRDLELDAATESAVARQAAVLASLPANRRRLGRMS